MKLLSGLFRLIISNSTRHVLNNVNVSSGHLVCDYRNVILILLAISTQNSIAEKPNAKFRRYISFIFHSNNKKKSLNKPDA